MRNRDRDMSNDPYSNNRALWDDWAAAHLDTSFYREFVAKLESGVDALLPLEKQELGDLAGLRVLHLQCHVGTDTLSLVRRGATVTGVDFSSVAIERARGLAQRLDIPADFVLAEIADLPEDFEGAFDLVFASYGVVNWLRDLDVWARAIHSCLRPGGRFYVVDGHPLAFCVADRCDLEGGRLTLEFPYLRTQEPVRFPLSGSYANPDSDSRHTSDEWPHGLAEIVMAVVDAGMQLEFVREHALGYAPILDGMVRGDDGHWRWPGGMDGKFPLVFSLSARRPNAPPSLARALGS
ncbi:MAG: class I SAM-dependent methyltransferase [Planctomycetes bacterium]|nr:class I SAM-dependent methyltransferase [Planctomycetota bacterium]